MVRHLNSAIIPGSSTRENALIEAITFVSDGLKLSGAAHVPQDLRPRERRPAIIMMHGFGANKNGGPQWICQKFAEWGYVALRFDYRGCGESEGERGRIIPSEEVADAVNAVSYMAARADVEPSAIALCGSSLGGGVAVQAAAIDARVAAVIVENGVANGERMIRSMHDAQSWSRFLALLDDARQQARTSTVKMIHRFDIFEMPKALQVNLTSNGSLMQFTADTALGFFMFRPEEFAAKISPRPILVLHSARDKVTTYEEAFSLVRMARPPVELHLLDGTDHFMFVNANPRVTFTLRNWLERYFPPTQSATTE
jgi:pimeloyl-ACP methyl ester carboxylesterase